MFVDLSGPIRQTTTIGMAGNAAAAVAHTLRRAAPPAPWRWCDRRARQAGGGAGNARLRAP